LTSVANTVAELVIDPAEERGSTNTGEAIMKATEELTGVRHSTEARKVLVLLTDGLATAPDDDPDAYALNAAAIAKSKDIDVFTIGLGASVNMDFVRKLASSNEQAYAVVSADQIDGIYRTITAALCEDGAAVIEIIPKTTASFNLVE